jgi:hypothetical protein
VSIAVDPEIQAAANLASAMAPLPAKAARTTRLEFLTIDASFEDGRRRMPKWQDGIPSVAILR